MSTLPKRPLGTFSKIGTVIEVEIGDLQIDYYVRQKPDPDHVLYLAELLEGGVELTPIEIVPNADGTGYILRDGRHRIEANQMLDRPTIKARVLPPAQDKAHEIALAFKANAGGSMPPSRDDTEHTIRLLLTEGVPVRDIAKLLPLPGSLAKKYIGAIHQRQLRARMKEAVEAVSEGTLNAPQAAERYKVDLDMLRKELGGRKKKANWRGLEIKRVIRSRFRSLSQGNAQMLRKLIAGFEDGDVSGQMLDTAVATLVESIRQLSVSLNGWKDRMKASREAHAKATGMTLDEEEEDE